MPDKVYCFGRGGPGIFFCLAWLEAVGNRICCHSNILRAADTVKKFVTFPVASGSNVRVEVEGLFELVGRLSMVF